MEKIVCEFNLFGLKQKIYIIDENNQMQVIESTLETLADDVARLSMAKNIANVYLKGPKAHSKKYAEDITTLAKTVYKKEDIITHLI